MTVRLAGAATGHVSRGTTRGGDQTGWRSHTFADGVRSITLTGPLDAATAGRLWSRLSELITHGCRRLIVDASAVSSGGDEPALLASAFAGRPVSCDAIVVARRGSPLVSMLPAWVGIAWSLSDARHQLETGIVHHEKRGAGPGGGISPGERNALAVRQQLRWAERSARERDYERALAWLSTVERVEGRLPAKWQQRRDRWLAAWREQFAAGDEASPASDLR